MRLFKRKSTEAQTQPCPRCNQLVSEADGSTCPMCGWDVHEAYHGPPRTSDTEAADRSTSDREERFRHPSRDSVM